MSAGDPTTPTPKVTLIDNYDSFTWNLVHELGALGAEVTVYRNDEKTADAILAERPDAIVLSPGPCAPAQAGVCLDVIDKAKGDVPIFGVCLGHQAIGEAFGGEVVRAPVPMHGKMSAIEHGATDVFRGINGPFQATRYHSLVVERGSMPQDLTVTAQADGLVMGMAHRSLPIYGVQFHPESIQSEHGRMIFKNFLDLAAAWNARKRGAGANVR
jgi:anthranilate synthase component 2